MADTNTITKTKRNFTSYLETEVMMIFLYLYDNSNMLYLLVSILQAFNGGEDAQQANLRPKLLNGKETR